MARRLRARYPVRVGVRARATHAPANHLHPKHPQCLHNPPGVTGDQLQASGGATVTAPAENTVSVSISGDFTANAGDIASVAYSVTMNANATAPIAYTTSASVTFLGIPQTLNGSGTI